MEYNRKETLKCPNCGACIDTDKYINLERNCPRCLTELDISVKSVVEKV